MGGELGMAGGTLVENVCFRVCCMGLIVSVVEAFYSEFDSSLNCVLKACQPTFIKIDESKIHKLAHAGFSVSQQNR